MTTSTRLLLITADDFGIGPETSRGILDLGAKGILTSTVLLTNSPYAADAVWQWRRTGAPLELGWHPCLTLDRPLAPLDQVRSLVDQDGRFHTLGAFLRRLVVGKIERDDMAREFQAQLERFIELVGRPPITVNAHHHVHVFRQVNRALRAVLDPLMPRPYVRRVTENWSTLVGVPGSRLKRLILSYFGGRAARRQIAQEYPGPDSLLGIADPAQVQDPEFFLRWLSKAPGRVLELTCHPGYFDETLIGRDGTLSNGLIHRRVQELQLLLKPEFMKAVQAAGFTLVTAEDLTEQIGMIHGLGVRPVSS